MLSYTHSRLIVGNSKSIVLSGCHIHIVDTKNGDLLQSTTRFEGTQKDAVIKSGPVRCSAVDRDFSRLVTTGDDKKLKVWEVETFKLLSERELPKKPTSIQLTRDGGTILVSDKFGDIFSYPTNPDISEGTSSTEDESLVGAAKRGALTSHENPSNGSLILGHTSLLTSFLLTQDEKYIVTADRDEHIRVSWYPQGYVIERYCLGHKKFVSAISIPEILPATLISGGGDPELKLWDWMTGQHLGDIPVMDVVEPLIKVKAPKSRSGWYRGDGDNAADKPERRKGKGRQGKGKTKADLDEADEGEEKASPGVKVEGENEKSVDAMDVPMTEAGHHAPVSQPQPQTSDSVVVEQPVTSGIEAEEQTVLVIHRIESFNFDECGSRIVFSAVGATALFYCAFPSLPVFTSSPEIQVLDLEKPVIDFTVEKNGDIWVLVDGQWSDTENYSPASELVKLVRWSGNELTVVGEENPLLQSLNTKCLIPATQSELKTLDIYAHLSSMPKNVDPEHDPMSRDDLNELITDDITAAVGPVAKQGRGRKYKDKKEGQELTQRELGRMKNKRALIAKIQEKRGQEESKSGSEGAVSSSGDLEERGSKKVKAIEHILASDPMDES